MFDSPFHPKIVHLPLGLAVVLPLVFLGLVVAIRAKWMAPRSWWMAVALAAVATVGGFAATQSGERDEKPVKAIVGRDLVHEHEEIGEKFALAMAATLGLALAGGLVRRDGLRTGLQGAAVVASLVACGLGVRAGQLGGELVYKHGAADAFREKAPVSPEEKAAAPAKSVAGAQ